MTTKAAPKKGTDDASHAPDEAKTTGTETEVALAQPEAAKTDAETVVAAPVEPEPAAAEAAPVAAVAADPDAVAEAAFNSSVKVRKGRGIQIREEDGKRIATLPRNCVLFMDTVLEAKVRPENWDGIEQYKDDPNVYEVSKEVPLKAFPKMDSAPTLAQSAKANLADKNVIEILRQGNPGSSAVIRVLVDSYEQKQGSQGVRSGAAKAATGAPKRRRRNAAAAPAADAAPRAARAPKMGNLDIKAFNETRLVMADIEAVKKQFPRIHKMFIEPVLAA
jgi:hypothetical protein